MTPEKPTGGVFSGDMGSSRRGKAPPPDPTKDGTHYDRCPEDGCIEVDRDSKIGGRTRKGEDYLDAAFYHADRQLGGCGANWVRTTKQGTARNHKRGVNAKWPTRAALVNQYIDVPSTAYRDNYDCAFGKCTHEPCEAARAARRSGQCSPGCQAHAGDSVAV